jgi:hypothetical protein
MNLVTKHSVLIENFKRLHISVRDYSFLLTPHSNVTCQQTVKNHQNTTVVALNIYRCLPLFRICTRVISF